MTLLTFLLSGAGRWFLAELLDFAKRYEERRAEEAAAQAAHLRRKAEAEWQAAAAQAAHSAGIELVHVKRESDAAAAAEAAFAVASAATTTQIAGTGWWVNLVNGANASVRPFGAYWAFLILTLEACNVISVGAFASEIAACFLGLFVGGRILRTGR